MSDCLFTSDSKITTESFKRIANLGQGSYAEVFLVQHLSTGQYFAMKRMKKRTYNGLTKFVITEKEVQRKIMHRFVCQLAYAFQTFDCLYLISDFCPGGDLRTILNQHEYLPEAQAVKWLAEILSAIDEIHKNGVIHRDIKPENVLIDGTGHAMLSDFGLAKEGIFEQ